MESLFAGIVLGHLVGDYFFQNKKMALSKTKKGLNGAFWCLLHSSLYSSMVCLFLWKADLVLLALIILSHYPIDRWSLAEKWLKIIGGRNLRDAYQSKEEYREFDIGFSCVVYTIVDNTMHLLLLSLITKMM